MKLCIVNEGMVAHILLEGYGRVLDIDYDNWKVDPKPKVLRLGDWRHPSTRNHLVAGLNLNYLNDRDLDKLRYYLPEILKDRHLYVRYHTGKKLLPNLFKNYYRTYRADKIDVIDKETLRYMTPKELEQQGDQERAKRLSDRRDKLRTSKKRGRIRASRRPEIELDIEPDDEPLSPEVSVSDLEQEPSPEQDVSPEELDLDTTKEKAKAAVDAKRADRMAARIDTRAQELEEPEENEPELEPEPELEELPPEDEEVPPEEE